MKTACTITTPYKNKLEAAYADLLEARKRAGEIVWWGYESMRLRIGDGALYTPDFVYLDTDGQLHIHETKGRWMEAAKVRIRVAASLYRFMRFAAVKKTKQGWEYESFGRNGEVSDG